MPVGLLPYGGGEGGRVLLGRDGGGWGAGRCGRPVGVLGDAVGVVGSGLLPFLLLVLLIGGVGLNQY